METFLKSEVPVFREHIIFNARCVEVHKISEVFCENFFCKMSDRFCYFVLVLRLSARQSEIRQNTDDVH